MTGPVDCRPIDAGVLRLQLAASIDRLRAERWRHVLVMLVVIFVVVGVIIHQLSSSGGGRVPVEAGLPRVEPNVTVTTLASSSAAKLVVQVAGAVVHPGVYELGPVDRVTDAVDKAGGLSTDADTDRLKLVDGQRIYVLRKGQTVAPQEAVVAAGTSTADQEPSIVDLNAATTKDLDALPGIGPAIAKAIVDYRNLHGPFRSVDDLSKVKGIGPAKLQNLRSSVRV